MKRAYTVIELLVSIAIIAVLMAVLCPVYVSCRRSAVETRRERRMHQMALFARVYCDQWEQMPGAGDDPAYRAFQAQDPRADLWVYVDHRARSLSWRVEEPSRNRGYRVTAIEGPTPYLIHPPAMTPADSKQ
jgi:prepilin-type N-terminal cleavage/methylation domain-containing protein